MEKEVSQLLNRWRIDTGNRGIEEALRQSVERYRLLVEQVKEYAIFSMNTEGRPTTWNEGVQRVLGFSDDDFIGADISPVISTLEDYAARIPQKELETAARTGTASNDRWLRRRRAEEALRQRKSRAAPGKARSLAGRSRRSPR
jgi:PAS domain S-box-containing protein